MCAQLMNPDRPAWKEVRHPTDAEKISAFAGFSAYCGKYEVDEMKQVMIHLPDVAWLPGFVGSKQPRPYTFSDSGDLLTFRTRRRGEPGAESYSITGKKAGSVPRLSPQDQSPRPITAGLTEKTEASRYCVKSSARSFCKR